LRVVAALDLRLRLFVRPPRAARRVADADCVGVAGDAEVGVADDLGVVVLVVLHGLLGITGAHPLAGRSVGRVGAPVAGGTVALAVLLGHRLHESEGGEGLRGGGLGVGHGGWSFQRVAARMTVASRTAAGAAAISSRAWSIARSGWRPEAISSLARVTRRRVVEL